MFKIKCPQCGSVKIDRINSQVRVYEAFFLEEKTGYVIEGGEERPYRYHNLCSDESIPPYIEEYGADQLEFECSECGYFFESCFNDDLLIEFALSNGLVVWKEI